MRTVNKHYTALALAVTLATALPLAALAAEDDYLDKSLPKEVPVKSFDGVYYDAEVPDTPDLAEHAHYAINQATRLWAPEWGYEQLFGVNMSVNPPILEMGHGGLLNCGPKVIEALPMLRTMTGSTYNIEVDGKAMGSILMVTGKDGLCYQPIENRPWAFFEEPTRKIGKPYSDIFGEGRQLLTYAAWYQHDNNPMWKKLAERKIKKLQSMTLKKDDGTLFFRLSRGYTPWDEDPTQGPIIPIGDHNVYDLEKGMVGTAASYIVGWIPQAGGIWYRVTGDKAALTLAKGLADYLYKHAGMIDPATGQWLADHESHVSHSLFSNLSYSLAAGDKAQAEWVNKAYQWHIAQRDPDKTGIIFSREACGLGDEIATGVMLSVAGLGDYWDNVDRWLRNTFLDQQVTNTDAIKKLPVTHPELGPAFMQPDDAAERSVGVWRGGVESSSTHSIGCCNGNCSRDLYYVWDNILTDKGKQMRINLLLNRASPWADVSSWLPYKGKVKLTMKVARDKVLVRVPEWAEKDKVTSLVNGQAVKGAWDGNYLNVGKVTKGQTVKIEFPIQQTVIDTKLRNKPCKVTMKGGTVIDITPPEDMYPIANHEKYKADKAPMKKVTRFVSKKRFLL